MMICVVIESWNNEPNQPSKKPTSVYALILAMRNMVVGNTALAKSYRMEPPAGGAIEEAFTPRVCWERFLDFTRDDRSLFPRCAAIAVAKSPPCKAIQVRPPVVSPVKNISQRFIIPFLTFFTAD